jgi:hypothetical protein
MNKCERCGKEGNIIDVKLYNLTSGKDMTLCKNCYQEIYKKESKFSNKHTKQGKISLILGIIAIALYVSIGYLWFSYDLINFSGVITIGGIISILGCIAIVMGLWSYFDQKLKDSYGLFGALISFVAIIAVLFEITRNM